MSAEDVDAGRATASASMSYADLLERNRRFLWNPFTQMRTFLDDAPVIVARGDGVRLIDVDGREYYDGNSSLWLNVHGHNRRELNDAIVDQLGRVAHTTLLGQSSVPAIELAERLAAISPAGLAKAFFSDSGAEAVEIGVKLAFAYWRRIGRPEKRRFLTMRNAYHGDTIGAVSIGGIDLFHAEFGPLLFQTEKVPYPHAYRFDGSEEECAQACLAELATKLDEMGEEIACLVVEPVVQAAAGMIVMPPGFLRDAARLCREHDVLLLADEVATGFGRTARMFACEHDGVEPDLMAVGKGLTGGYLPVAATLTSDAIYDVFSGEFADQKAFYHGHSYTGNQLGCAVALASLELFESDRLIDKVGASSALLAELLVGIGDLPHVGDVRQRGLLIGIELVADRVSRTPFDWRDATGARVCRRARELGMVTRPLGDVVTFVPPLVTEEADLRVMVEILAEALAGVGAA